MHVIRNTSSKTTRQQVPDQEDPRIHYISPHGETGHPQILRPLFCTMSAPAKYAELTAPTLVHLVSARDEVRQRLIAQWRPPIDPQTQALIKFLVSNPECDRTSIISQWKGAANPGSPPTAAHLNLLASATQDVRDRLLDNWNPPIDSSTRDFLQVLSTIPESDRLDVISQWQGGPTATETPVTATHLNLLASATDDVRDQLMNNWKPTIDTVTRDFLELLRSIPECDRPAFISQWQTTASPPAVTLEGGNTPEFASPIAPIVKMDVDNPPLSPPPSHAMLPERPNENLASKTGSTGDQHEPGSLSITIPVEDAALAPAVPSDDRDDEEERMQVQLEIQPTDDPKPSKPKAKSRKPEPRRPVGRDNPCRNCRNQNRSCSPSTVTALGSAL